MIPSPSPHPAQATHSPPFMATSIPPAPPPYSILFVCLGNICRSPMCEAVLRHLTSSTSTKSTSKSTGESTSTSSTTSTSTTSSLTPTPTVSTPQTQAQAEAQAKAHPLISAIDSAGTGAYHVLDPPDPRTIATLRRHGIPNYWDRDSSTDFHSPGDSPPSSSDSPSSSSSLLSCGARQVRLEDFEEFDWILAMDRANLRDLERVRRRAVKEKVPVKAKVMLFGEYGGKHTDRKDRGEGEVEGEVEVEVEEVGDPYYGENDGFEEVFQQVWGLSRRFLEYLEETVERPEEA